MRPLRTTGRKNAGPAGTFRLFWFALLFAAVAFVTSSVLDLQAQPVPDSPPAAQAERADSDKPTSGRKPNDKQPGDQEILEEAPPVPEIREPQSGGSAPAGGWLVRTERRIDAGAGRLNAILERALTFRVAGIPFIVLWLLAASILFTVQMGFINVRAFKHALLVTAGRYDDPAHAGEVSHYQALAAALSGTLGLGNIAGVAIAIATGGPGATLWMIFAGLVGMSAKFVECTLGQKYREVRPDGQIMGGAMYYLSRGLEPMGLGGLGKFLALFFCVMCIGGSLGGGNAFQVSQSLNGIYVALPGLEAHRWIYGLLMTILVGLVILGGIRRIAATAEKIVPLMCALYVAACLWVLLAHFDQLPSAVVEIFWGAFQPEGIKGGVLGVLAIGFQRAAFSNEAGMGSAAIAHSAAKTPYPVREGIVALLEPFIDTVVVCTITALVIVVSGVCKDPAYAELIKGNQGSALTAHALGATVKWFSPLLALCVFLFAYATLISWFYYGERCWSYLFGDHTSIWFKLIYLVFTMLGSIVSAKNVLIFGDLMILGMGLPNVIGVLLLSREVRRDLNDYWTRYRAGEFASHR
jgi:alanine or glycine:cation symporter, AGCS family